MTQRFPITVAAPPSKSISHRKLIAAALAPETTSLSRVLESDDTFVTMDVLRSAGASIEKTGEGAYRVTGPDGPPRGGRQRAVSCFMGESGTSCRLLTAVLAAGDGLFSIHGGARLHERPIRDLMLTLTALGASVAYRADPGHLPLDLRARGLSQPGDSWLPVRGDISSQFLSGLLLAAPLAENGLRILLSGEKVVSWPYVGLTLLTLEEAGCSFSVEVLRDGMWAEADWRALREVRPGATRFTVRRGKYHSLTGDAAVVEGDYSGASYLLAAGAIGPNPVSVTNLRRDSLQGDRAILDILQSMGATVTWNGNAVTVSPGRLRGIDCAMGHCPDLVPTVAVLASMAEGDTTIRGIEHLKGKESDRLEAPAMELAKTGCGVTVADGALFLSPARRRPGGAIRFSAHHDHRMAMCLALLELAGTQVRLDDPGCVSKSFPSFWKTWHAICPESRIGDS